MYKIGSSYDQLEEALTNAEGDLAQVDAVLSQYNADLAIEYEEGKLYTVGEAVVDVTDKGIVTTWQDANDFLNSYNTEQYLPFDPDEQFNKDFWDNPSELYHGTLQGHLDSIMKGGLNPRNETRGMSNRGTPSAVFTSTDWDEANHYYETVLSIDTAAMKAELLPTSLPFAGRESDIVEGEGKETLANALGYEDYSYDFEQGMSPNTVILYGAIPPKYLSIAKEDTNPSKRWHLGSKTAAIVGNGWAIWEGHVLLNPKTTCHADWFERLGIPSSGTDFDRIPRGNYVIYPDTERIYVWTDAETGSPTTRCWGNKCFDMEFAPPEVIEAIKDKHPKARDYQVYDEVRSGLRLHGSKNAAGILDNPKFQAWFRGSKVVDAQGNPLRCYHGTRAGEDFEEFSTEGPPANAAGEPMSSGSGHDPTAYLGAHFAQEPQVANQFALGTGWQRYRYDEDAKPRVIPVYLSIRNPKDFGVERSLRRFIYQGKLNGYPEDLLYRAMEADEIGHDEDEDQSEEEKQWFQRYDTDDSFRMEQNRWLFERFTPEEGEDDLLHEAAHDLAMQAHGRLEAAGHDGIRYANEVEGGISWIVFSPSQAKSALGNAGAFDPSNPSMVASKQAAGEWWRRWRKTLLLKKGTILYHGTAQDFSADELRTPAWFSTSESVAEYFESWHGGEGEGQRILRFQVVKPIRLPRVDSIEDLDKLSDMFGFPRPQSGMDYADDLARVLPGWVIPHQYPDGDDILLASTDGIIPLYDEEKEVEGGNAKIATRGRRIPIEEAESRCPDMVKGQEWKGNGAKYWFKCDKHGNYLQAFSGHDRGYRCPRCGYGAAITLEEAETKFPDMVKGQEWHGTNAKYQFICKKHGEYEQRFYHHVSGHRCPACFESLGERAIVEVLNDFGYGFKREATFKDLKHKRSLRFDFYLTERKTLIEFNGIQHYEPRFTGNPDLAGRNYQDQQTRDKIKEEWAKSNGFSLIVIPYTMRLEDIPEYLRRNLGVSSAVVQPRTAAQSAEGVPEGMEEPSTALGTPLERKEGAFQKAAFPRNQVISPQEALDRKLFGPVWHGTAPEIRETIDAEGFKIFEGEAATGPIRNGFEGGVKEYALGLPPPVHFLGYGVYFTTSKGVAKKFNMNSERGLKTYYLDVPRLKTINFNAPHTMMKWWLKNGYPPDLAKTDRVAATKVLTENLKSKFDAVFHKGGGFKTIDMGPQVAVFDPSRIYLVDPSLAKPGEIGCTVVRKADGMKGRLLGKREIMPTNDAGEDVRAKYHHGQDTFLYVQWARGKDYGVYPDEVEFVQPKTAAPKEMVTTKNIKTQEALPAVLGQHREPQDGAWSDQGLPHGHHAPDACRQVRVWERLPVQQPGVQAPLPQHGGRMGELRAGPEQPDVQDQALLHRPAEVPRGASQEHQGADAEGREG